MKIRCLLACLCTLLTSFTSLRGQSPSTNDLWDVSKGITILAHSPLDDGFGDPLSYDAANIFGATNGTFVEGQMGRVVFSDNQPAGFVHFVEWRTPTPVMIRSFRLFASGENAGLRDFAQFRLLVKTNGSSTFNHTLQTFTPTHPYSYVDTTNSLLFVSEVQPLTAQEFRAEFITMSGTPTYYNGPRILELDGFSDPLDIKVSIRSSQVEVCWDTSSGTNYRVEYKDQMTGGAWLNLTSTIAGTGTRMCIADVVPEGAPSRYYRVRRLD